ncbi:Zinc finger BED domain-containing protein DAYSLEEPER [Fusarium oxysporum f. sp. raphani]|uniref:Zinc finger BED domain-containing protein DAYSLEEPER n=1 Tax=Fusarium oxysporum f. sp. raphani TaxID=96318 RepID=A0A8J5U056_FUSOX|nr:Zinc finger BED domain-containing protein DAYSLEEPER [Fusarium oxysporum f. sp. raphani]
MSPRRKKQRTLFDMVGLDARQGKDQAVMNAFITSFDPLRFQRLLIRWVACDNVPFNTLESPYFRELMEYANSAIIESGSLPTHNTMREWIVRTFNRHKGVVTELLGRSLSRINVSFDVWTSRKYTSLLGLTRSGQRIDKLHKLQSIENTALGLEDRSTYDVITDNATRWNSSEAMMDRGYQLRNPLDSLVQAEVPEWDQYVAMRTEGGTRPMPKRSRKKPAIVDDKMSTTKRLEGRPEEGKYGAIWEVLLTMEWLLQHLEDSKLQHEHDEEPYLRIGCNLGWMKLDKYYTLTEDSPVYLAALVLHPAFRWPSVESQWADHPDWLERGKIAVRELLEEYRKLPVEQDTIPEQPTAARKTTDLDDFMASVRKLSTQRAPSAPPTRDEYAEWLSTSDPGDYLVDNPIQYWLLRRRQYPRLSRMAIDLFSVPAMSSEPERIFSLAGQMVTPLRRQLQADIVGAARCISSWEKSGAIEISK